MKFAETGIAPSFMKSEKTMIALAAKTCHP